MTQTDLFANPVSQNERNLNEQPIKDIIPETSRKGVKSKVLAI